MTGEVRLTLISSVDAVQQYTFLEPVTCTIGRAEDCTIVVAPSVFSGDVSRHHCELRIGFHPLRATARDLESLNGTHVNGAPIGQRFTGSNTLTAKKGQLVLLKDGDELRLGKGTAFRVEIREHVASTYADDPAPNTSGGLVEAFTNLLTGWRRKGEP